MLGIVLKAGIVVAAVLINTGVCIVAFRVTRDVTYRQLVPGALTAAILWQLLQWFRFALRGPRRQIGQSNQQRVRALGLGLLAFLYLIATSLLVSAEINVVRTDHVYPRALLTPFTDDVEFTPGDRKAYAGRAKAQRAKGVEHVDVTFNKNDDE